MKCESHGGAEWDVRNSYKLLEAVLVTSFDRSLCQGHQTLPAAPHRRPTIWVNFLLGE